MARKPTKSLKIEAVKDEDKEKALSAALATLEKNYGKGSIMRLDGEKKLNDEISIIPTGSIGLDHAIGIGGCLLYTSPSPRDQRGSRMPSSA